MDDYIKFNKKAKEFLKDITKTFPELSDLKLMKNALKVVKKISKKTPHRIFDSIVTPYKDQILRRDDAFFITDDFQIESLRGLKGIWGSLSDVNKNIIWDYLKILIVANDACKKLDTQNIASDEDDSE